MTTLETIQEFGEFLESKDGHFDETQKSINQNFEKFDSYVESLKLPTIHVEFDFEQAEAKSIIHARYLQSKVHEDAVYPLNGIMDRIFATIKYLDLMERNYWFFNLQRVIGNSILPGLEDVETFYRTLYHAKADYYKLENIKTGFVEFTKRWHSLSDVVEKRIAAFYKRFIKVFRIHTAHKINDVKKLNCKCGRFIGFSDRQKTFCLETEIETHRVNNTINIAKGLCPTCNQIEKTMYNFCTYYGVCNPNAKFCGVCVATISELRSINTQLLMWCFVQSHLLVLIDIWKNYGNQLAGINMVDVQNRGLLTASRFQEIHHIPMNDFYFADCQDIARIQELTASHYSDIIRRKAQDLEKKKA